MKKEKEYISIEDIEVINSDEYKANIREFTYEDDAITKILTDKMGVSFNKKNHSKRRI